MHKFKVFTHVIDLLYLSFVADANETVQFLKRYGISLQIYLKNGSEQVLSGIQ